MFGTNMNFNTLEFSQFPDKPVAAFAIKVSAGHFLWKFFSSSVGACNWS